MNQKTDEENLKNLVAIINTGLIPGIKKAELFMDKAIVVWLDTPERIDGTPSKVMFNAQQIMLNAFRESPDLVEINLDYLEHQINPTDRQAAHERLLQLLPSQGVDLEKDIVIEPVEYGLPEGFTLTKSRNEIHPFLGTRNGVPVKRRGKRFR